jgi:hypothetical protein
MRRRVQVLQPRAPVDVLQRLDVGHRTCSSILWMVALTGPNSITCGQMREMKRPSLVPPVVDSSVSTPVSARMACRTARHQFAGRGEEGLAADRPGQLVVEAVAVEHLVHALLQAFGRADAVESGS